MFNGLTSLGGLLGLYSGAPILAAVGSATNGFSSNSSGYHTFGPLLAVFLPLFFLWMTFCFAAAVLMLVSLWKIFEKTGRPGWAGIIPIYNVVLMFQMVGMSPWLILLAVIPFVGPFIFFIVSIMMYVKLARAFGQGEGFAVGLILLPIVFLPILAFGQARFN